MSALTRIDSFDQLFPEMFWRFARPLRLADDATAEIRIDVTENDKDSPVRAEVPGAKKEEIRVSVDGTYVSITAETRKEREEKSGGRVILRETATGSVPRGFSLAHDIDESRVVAKLEEGVPKATLPKREGTGSRAIAIQ